MSDIGADKVKELRDKTGAGMMDCKKALASTGGDLEKAIDFLRKEGVVKAAKKSGRATSEGLIGVVSNPTQKAVAIVEVNCETDFVARTDQFQQFIDTIGEQILKSNPKDLEQLLAQKMGAVAVQEALSQLVAKIGENIAIRRFRLISAGADEVIASYLHAGAKIGSVIKIKGTGVDEGVAREIAMHAAAMMPTYIQRDQVPADALEREKAVLQGSPELQGKPANIVEKIIQGKLNRYYSDHCLIEQPFIKDTSGKKSVGDFLKEKSPTAQVVEMARFQVGGAE